MAQYLQLAKDFIKNEASTTAGGPVFNKDRQRNDAAITRKTRVFSPAVVPTSFRVIALLDRKHMRLDSRPVSQAVEGGCHAAMTRESGL